MPLLVIVYSARKLCRGGFIEKHIYVWLGFLSLRMLFSGSFIFLEISLGSDGLSAPIRLYFVCNSLIISSNYQFKRKFLYFAGSVSCLFDFLFFSFHKPFYNPICLLHKDTAENSAQKYINAGK